MLEHFITDLRSCRAIIKLMKGKNYSFLPNRGPGEPFSIIVDAIAYKRIYDDLYDECGITAIPPSVDGITIDIDLSPRSPSCT